MGTVGTYQTKEDVYPRMTKGNVASWGTQGQASMGATSTIQHQDGWRLHDHEQAASGKTWGCHEGTCMALCMVSKLAGHAAEGLIR